MIPQPTRPSLVPTFHGPSLTRSFLMMTRVDDQESGKWENRETGRIRKLGESGNRETALCCVSQVTLVETTAGKPARVMMRGARLPDSRWTSVTARGVSVLQAAELLEPLTERQTPDTISRCLHLGANAAANPRAARWLAAWMYVPSCDGRFVHASQTSLPGKFASTLSDDDGCSGSAIRRGPEASENGSAATTVGALVAASVVLRSALKFGHTSFEHPMLHTIWPE